MKEIELKDGERIDDLERNGLGIIQKRGGFCFGMDAVLLSGFARIKPGDKAIDLGCGNGILPLLLNAKTEAAHITGLEIQEESFDMARRSVLMNGLEKDIEIVCGDIKGASAIFGRASFDVVTCNPPYIKAGAGIINPEGTKAVARHEVLCTFEDVARETKALLASGGRFFLVHRPQRLTEIIGTLRKNGLEPKRMKMVHSFADDDAVLVLIESVSGGKAELMVEKPLIIYKAEDEYTDEIHEIYGF